MADANCEQPNNVVTDDNISFLFGKNGVAKESIISNLETLCKNQLRPDGLFSIYYGRS